MPILPLFLPSILSSYVCNGYHGSKKLIKIGILNNFAINILQPCQMGSPTIWNKSTFFLIISYTALIDIFNPKSCSIIYLEEVLILTMFIPSKISVYGCDPKRQQITVTVKPLLTIRRKISYAIGDVVGEIRPFCVKGKKPRKSTKTSGLVFIFSLIFLHKKIQV